MIHLRQVTLRRGSKLLLEQADLSLFDKEKVGIVGANGVGKSSLYQCILGNIVTDGGEIDIPGKLTMAHLKQETPSCETSAIDYALEGDAEYAHLHAQMQAAEDSDDGMAMAEAVTRFAEIDGYSAASRAAIILKGLGFSQEQLHESVNSFSGGWRMRLNLAQVLLSRADFMLLDEPTNHLDLEGIFWLADWIKSASCLVIIVSHDREFLDDITTHIVHFNDHVLKKYTGNYSLFEKEYATQLAIQKMAYSKQQKERAHMQKFVDRFGAKATKAKQAQSRVKRLEKMELVAAVHERSPFNFKFSDIPSGSNPILSLEHASTGYGDNVILSDINFSLSDGSRYGLLGLNGAGKSTLIKLLAGDLPVMKGSEYGADKVKVGYFAQHQLEQLDGSSDLISHLKEIDKKISEGEARKFLGGFNFKGDQVFAKISSLSGGEKSRLVLALLVWQKPTLLLMDEPTNHLDMEMREALIHALQNYAGALVLVSHDRHLLNCLVDEFWLVDEGSVSEFSGDLDDYRKMINEREKAEAQLDKSKKMSKKKVNLAHTEKQLEKAEKKLDKLQKESASLEEKLADADLYLDSNKDRLTNLQAEHKAKQVKIQVLDGEITELLSQLCD